MLSDFNSIGSDKINDTYRWNNEKKHWGRMFLQAIIRQPTHLKALLLTCMWESNKVEN